MLAADEPRKKQRLFGIRIKRALYDRLSGGGADRRGKACACQLPEALLGLQERIRVLRIEIVPSIAGDPSRFVWPSDPPLQGTGILRAVSANAQTQQRNVRSKLTVSRGSPLLVWMHPKVRRDLARLGQPIAADFPLA